jgi:F0F1-type ATP synthase epsilon subunit
MQLIISSPDGEILNQSQVDWVNLTLSNGYPISIYPKHSPLIALTSACTLKYRIKDQVSEKQIPSGVLSVSGGQVKCFLGSDDLSQQNEDTLSES